MKRLGILVPSRGRPSHALRLADAVERLSQSGSTDLLIGTDYDDALGPGYLAALGGRPAIYLLQGEREPMVARTNSMWAEYSDVYDYWCSLGDDHVPMTEGWDVKLISAIEDGLGGTGIAYPNDTVMGPNLPTVAVMSRDIPETLGWIGLPSLGHYCVVPETPVLTANLSWVRAGKLTLGDQLVGVDELQSPRSHRRYRRSSISSIHRRLAPCVHIELEDGRVVTASADHRWLALRRWMGTGAGPGRYEWRESALLRSGDMLASPLRTWGQETSFESGWLTGIFDGEGSAGRTLTVAQNPGAVLHRIEAMLTSMGIGFTISRNAAQSQCIRITVSPRRDAIELLGRLQPVRLSAAAIWEDAAITNRKAHYGVVRSVTPAGVLEVVSMETTSATFIADGLVAHNCCDNVWKDIGMGAGCLAYCPDVIVQHRHWSASLAMLDATYAEAGGFSVDHPDYGAYLRWQDQEASANIEAIRQLVKDRVR